MAHFAEIEEGTVKRVIVIDNSDCLKDGIEDEATGAAFCNQLRGGTWKQTSYNGNIRKHYAGIGHTYDPDRDAFIPPQPYSSWALDDDCNWHPPTPMPSDGKLYLWDESTLTWQHS